MTKLFFIVVGVILIFHRSRSQLQPQREENSDNLTEDAGTTRTVFLGSVDGKSYFADTATGYRSWNASLQFCDNLGMRLGTITTPAQLQFLRSAYNSTNFDNVHWIAARDSFLQRQFSWDVTNTEVTGLNGIPWGTYLEREFQTCAAYFSYPQPRIWLYPCRNGLHSVLCETI